MFTIEVIQAFASGVGIIGVLAGIYLGVRQLSATTGSQQTQTLLQFDEMLDRRSSSSTMACST